MIPLSAFQGALLQYVQKVLAQNGEEQRDTPGCVMVSVNYCQPDRVQNYPENGQLDMSVGFS